MCVWVHGDLGMCWLFSGPAELSYLKCLIHPSKKAAHVEMRDVWFGASEKPHVLVYENSPLRTETWKPKLRFRLGPGGLSISTFCLWGHCLRV